MAKMDNKVVVVPLTRNPEINQTNLQCAQTAEGKDGYTSRGGINMGNFAYLFFSKKVKEGQ